ncbi:MAG: hypothetical protein HC851_19280 [Acaryochloris sp. RU_4_1]|nr:hypothetical protein [Acaryochloris sp. RU_4_1]NJR57151.1 hypothetical protein [Acaryochloris sp. CRU_2_0]
MICPECNGNGFLRIPSTPDSWETSQNPFANEREINCSTCEGQGELPDEPPTNHCPACGEPIPGGSEWCEEHQAAGSFKKKECL